MKMRGQKTPQKIKALQGTLNSTREKERKKKPFLKWNGMSELPHPPPIFKLTLTAKKIWYWHVEELVGLRILTKNDLPILAIYCQEIARYFAAEKEIKKTGIVYKNKSGHRLINPYFLISQKSYKVAYEIAGKFGFTPVSRDKIVVPTSKKDGDEIDKLLNT